MYSDNSFLNMMNLLLLTAVLFACSSECRTGVVKCGRYKHCQNGQECCGGNGCMPAGSVCCGTDYCKRGTSCCGLFCCKSGYYCVSGGCKPCMNGICPATTPMPDVQSAENFKWWYVLIILFVTVIVVIGSVYFVQYLCRRRRSRTGGSGGRVISQATPAQQDTTPVQARPNYTNARYTVPTETSSAPPFIIYDNKCRSQSGSQQIPVRGKQTAKFAVPRTKINNAEYSNGAKSVHKQNRAIRKLPHI